MTEPEQWAEELYVRVHNLTGVEAIALIQRAFEERTGQLVPAQPSGDEVEAVARALYEEDDPWCKAWPWPNLQPDQASPDAYRRLATAAITAYEALRAKEAGNG